MAAAAVAGAAMAVVSLRAVFHCVSACHSCYSPNSEPIQHLEVRI